MTERWTLILCGSVLPIFAALALTILLAGAPTSTPPANRAALVIRVDSSTMISRCVNFSEPAISGYDLLLRSGLNITASVSSGGATICGIAGTGCPDSDCFCAYPPNYWSYWHWQDGGWAYSGVGAGGYQVHDGDLDGWSWNPSMSPPEIAYDEVCPPPQRYFVFLPNILWPSSSR